MTPLLFYIIQQDNIIRNNETFDSFVNRANVIIDNNFGKTDNIV